MNMPEHKAELSGQTPIRHPFGLFITRMVMAGIILAGCGDESDFEDDSIGVQTQALVNRDVYHDLANEISDAIMEDPALEKKIKKKVAKAVKKTINQGKGKFCPDRFAANLTALPTIPTKLGFNLDRSFDLGDKSIELTCRYDISGELGPERRYYCCLYGETTIDLAEGGFRSTEIGVMGAIQLNRRSVFTGQVGYDFDAGQTTFEAGVSVDLGRLLGRSRR